MKKIFLSIVAYVAPFVALADGGYGSMMPWGWGMMGGGNFFMFLAMIVWLVVGVLAAIWLWQHIDRK